MSNTPNLALPYLAAGQAQKHVSVNESLRRLDALVQIGVSTRAQANPPASPAEGQRLLVPAAPGGAFAGHAGQIAAWQDGLWQFYAPQPGWLAFVADEALLLAFDGSTWTPAAGTMQNLPFVGINATADSTNRLSLSAPASLFNNAGNGHQIKVNKAAATDVVSLLFQTNWSGRAEMGLSGDDRFRIKVSADGNTWVNALEVSGAGTVGIGVAAGSVTLALAGALRVGSFTLAGLPAAASAGAGAVLLVSNESGGAVLAFSDGAAWRRVTDRAVVS